MMNTDRIMRDSFWVGVYPGMTEQNDQLYNRYNEKVHSHMKVLVTGTTGFIGSNLSRRLLELGYEVHSFKRSSSDIWRLVDVRKNIIEHVVDLRDADTVGRNVEKIRPQVVYHCATYGGFADQKDTTAILESNFLGTVNLLKACERVGFDYFVNTGSSSEYGIKSHPMDEGNLQHNGDYGVSKAAATLFCQSEGRGKQLPIATLRLFSLLDLGMIRNV